MTVSETMEKKPSEETDRKIEVVPLKGPVETLQKRGLIGSLRMLSVLAFVAALLWVSQPTWTTVLAGAPFVAVGIWWRVWASGHLLKTKEVAVSGPYRHVQNPLYFGRLCLGTGFCLIAWTEVVIGGTVVPLNLVALAGFWLVFFVYYMPRKKRVEGGRLTKLHGATYTEWAEHVPLVIPRLTPHGENVRQWDRARFERLHEGLMVAMLVAVTVAFAIKAAMASGTP